MYTSAAVFTALVAAVHVSASPLRVLGPANGSPAARQRVKDATDHAHAAVLQMEEHHTQAMEGNSASLAHFHKAFGKHVDMRAVGSHIQTLKDHSTGKYKMTDAQHPTYSGVGYHDPNTGLVHFGAHFHASDQTVQHRAGHVLHEASHHILGTKDVFDRHGNPIHKTRPDVVAGEHSGYKDSGLEHLKAHPASSRNLHHNADSWRVLGHSVAPDHVKARELARRELVRELLAARSNVWDLEDLD